MNNPRETKIEQSWNLLTQLNVGWYALICLRVEINLRCNWPSNYKINMINNHTVNSTHTLNLSWSASMSSFTLWISWVWYSRIAPLMCGRTNRALNLEKILNISFAFLAVPSWSRKRAVIRVSTLSMRSSYLQYKAIKF